MSFLKRLLGIAPLGLFAGWVFAGVSNPEATANGKNALAIGINTAPIHTYSYDNRKKIINSFDLKSLTNVADKLNALIPALYPTNVELVDIQWEQWLGDSEDQLTVSLKNQSEVPASDITVRVLNPASGNTYAKLKPFELRKSNALRELEGSNIALAAGTSTRLPVVGITDLKTIVRPDVHGYCIYDASLETEKLGAGMDSFDAGLTGESRTRTIGVLLQVGFKTIFGENILYTKWVFVKYATRDSNFVVDKVGKKKVALKCID